MLEKINLSGTGKVTIAAEIISHTHFKLNQSGTVDLDLLCGSSESDDRNFGSIKISKSGTGTTKCPLGRVKQLKVKCSGTSVLKGFLVQESCHLSGSGYSKIIVNKSNQCKVLKQSVSGCAKISIE